MKLFLSYPSAQRDLAERLTLALESEGHEVFIDRADLKPGQAFHQTLREAILGADAMLFLVTPEAVTPGSYALAELGIAQQRWRRPGGHVLPVMVTATPIAALPSYLSAVTVLQPRGDAVAEIVAAVAHLSPPPVRRRATLVAAVALVLVATLALGTAAWRQSEQRAAERARLDIETRDLAQAASASELCDSGGHAVALGQLNELVARQSPLHPPSARLLDSREDCAMRWLRDMRAVVGKQTFGEQVVQAQPVLVQGLSRTSGARAADLRAHIGWGEYLRGRDGISGVNPAAHWRRALADDAGNVYANAMWARQLLDRPGHLDEAKARFATALAGGVTDSRGRVFVRALQFGATLGGNADAAANVAYAVAVADEMRRGAEVIRPDHRDRLWTRALGATMFDAETRAAVVKALPPPDLLATFVGLFPADGLSDDRRPIWRFVHATLQAEQAGAGSRSAARAGFESLLLELRTAGSSGRLVDEAQRGLDRLRTPGRAR